MAWLAQIASCFPSSGGTYVYGLLRHCVFQKRLALRTAQVQNNGPAFTLGGGAFLEGEGEVARLRPFPRVLPLKALGLDHDQLLTGHLQDEGKLLAACLA